MSARKVALFMVVTLDGFFEGPDHELDWQLILIEEHPVHSPASRETPSNQPLAARIFIHLEVKTS